MTEIKLLGQLVILKGNCINNYVNYFYFFRIHILKYINELNLTTFTRTQFKEFIYLKHLDNYFPSFCRPPSNRILKTTRYPLPSKITIAAGSFHMVSISSRIVSVIAGFAASPYVIISE